MDYELKMEGITKTFGQVMANEKVDFCLKKGEIHGLLGENGAGKSTLMNCLYGMFPPTDGNIFIRGKPVHISSPQAAIAQGIGMVHQHFMLISDLTVTENVVLGMRQKREPLLDLKSAAKQVQALSDQYGFGLDPMARVGDLPVGVQQRIEILKVLYRGADIIVFDEATAMLTPQEVFGLFAVIHQMANEGKSVIMIVHKLEEVMEICDRVTTLRDGRVVGTVPIAKTDVHQLAKMMVGREVVLDIPRPPMQLGEVVLQAQNLYVEDGHGQTRVENVSLTLRAGEIFGLAGIDGNGQMELTEALTGLLPLKQGKICLEGRVLKSGIPRDFIRHKVAYIPQDRHHTGLVLEFDIKENLVLHGHDSPPFAVHGVIDKKELEKNGNEKIQEFSIKASGASTSAGTLSGGNQQKVVLARELGRDVAVLVAVQPTRGLDIGATEFVRKKILQQRANRVPVFLVSTELDEILALSDRIGVIHKGKIVATFQNGEYNVEQIGLLMAGVSAKKMGADADET